MTRSSVIRPEVWSAIAADPLDRGFVRRRILPKLPYDIFVGERRPSREPVLLLSIGDVNVAAPTRDASSRGLRVDIKSGGPSGIEIELVSTTRAGDELFHELASDVVGVLTESSGTASAAERVLARIEAWQSFFAKKREEFTPQLAAALFAELEVLQQGCLPALPPVEAARSWRGPDPALQDFQYGSAAVEVKSFRGHGPGEMTITSERQLDSTGTEHLFVALVRLDQRVEGAGSTIMDKIDEVRRELSTSLSALDVLERGLLAYGWHDSYGSHRPEKYTVRSCELFAVTPDFPRLIPERLPKSIKKVTYVIERGGLDEFLVTWEDLHSLLKESE
jgi:hypothetical protein